jgi:REP element-mobilizing transposase RayT
MSDCIRQASSARFRIVQFSVQHDHVHLLVEASEKRALSSGARGLAIRTHAG